MTNKTELVSVPRELLSRIAATFMFSLRDCDYKAICEILAAPPEDVRAVVEEPLDWSYCPECGCDEVRHQEGKHKQCAECHQEYWSDIDYEDVVSKKLRRLFSHPQRPVMMPDRRILPRFDLHPLSFKHWQGWNACLDEFERLNK